MSNKHLIAAGLFSLFSATAQAQDLTLTLTNLTHNIYFTPVVAGVGKGAKALATKGKDLAYSNSRIERYLSKVAEAFTPEGALTKALFGSQRVMEGFRAADLNRATELVKTLDRSVSRAFPQMQKVLDRSLTIKEKEKFYNEINELILDGDLTKLTDGKTVDQFVKKLNKKGIDEKTSTEIVKKIDEARTEFANLMETTCKFNAPELKNILQ